MAVKYLMHLVAKHLVHPVVTCRVRFTDVCLINKPTYSLHQNLHIRDLSGVLSRLTWYVDWHYGEIVFKSQN